MNQTNHIPLNKKIQLWIVSAILWVQNAILELLRMVFFSSLKNPKNILVYRLGNIGDVVCAMPALWAIKNNFPNSHITLLTSPGKRGAIGAKDFLEGVSYLDKIEAYYFDDIATIKKWFSLITKLRKENFDFFIQLPDDLANFRTLLRNDFFAKAIGAKSAIGFCLRTSQIFKKTQVDFTFKQTESLSLLDILAKNGIKSFEVKFEFPEYVSASLEINSKLTELKKTSDVILGVCMGGKTEGQRWPLENFSQVLNQLVNRYKTGVVFFGSRGETASIEKVANIAHAKYINFAGQPIKESINLIKQMDIFLTNDTGPMHIAAAFGIPVVAMFSIRNVFGTWFPYGKGHQNIYKKNLNCNYLSLECAKKSMEMISVEEVVSACATIIKHIKY